MTLRHRVASEHGSALVELALTLPMLMVLMVGTIDFARVFYTAMELTAAARAGAHWGGYGSTYASRWGDGGLIEQHTIAAVPNLNLTKNDIVVTTKCSCVSDNGLTATTPTWTLCTAPTTCADNLEMNVTVNVTKTFTTVASSVPFIPNSVTLTRSATMRVAQ